MMRYTRRSLVACLAACGGGLDEAAHDLELGVAPSYDVNFDSEYDYAGLRADGVRRVNLYYLWKDFDTGPGGIPDGAFDDVDTLVGRLQESGMRASAIVAITDTDCQENDTDECWLGYGLPEDLVADFDGFDSDPLLMRARALARAFAEHFDGATLTHVLIGNETSSFLETRPEHRDGLVELIAAIGDEVGTVSPRPRFGTILGHDADAPDDWHADLARQIAAASDVAAYTLYPSLVPSFEDVVVEPDAELVARWFGRAVDLAGGRPIVVSETGYHVCGTTGSVERQMRYAEEVVAYVRDRADRFDYVTWWSYWDSPEAPFGFFRCTGLETADGSTRPAHSIWMAATR